MSSFLVTMTAVLAANGCGAPVLGQRYELTQKKNWQLTDDRYAELVAANKKLLTSPGPAEQDPLCRAILERRHARVRALLKVGVDLTQPRTLDNVVETIAHRKHERSGAWASLPGSALSAQPLQLAALKADAAMVRLLLDAGASVDGGGEFTALVAATERTPSAESAEIVDVLLRAGANPNGLPRGATGAVGAPPVDCSRSHALEAWHPQCASQCAPIQRVLMRTGGRDRGWLSGYVIDRSASGTNGDLIETIQLGHWPPSTALREPRERIVRALLAAGASADPPAHWHDYYALRTDRNLLESWPKWRTCPLALWAGIAAGLSDELVVTLSGRTAYSPTAYHWKEEVFDGLEGLALERPEALTLRVLHEQLPRLAEHERRMALELVAMRGASGILTRLLREGVKPATVDNAGRGYVPALVSAAAHCDVGGVTALLRAGANPNRRSEVDGARPLNVACPSVAPLLREAGGTESPRSEMDAIIATREAELTRLRRRAEESERDRNRRFARAAGELRQMTRDWEVARDAAERRREAERESVSRAVAQGLASGLQHAATELRPAPPPTYPGAAGWSGAGGSAPGASTSSPGASPAPAPSAGVGTGPAGARPPGPAASTGAPGAPSPSGRAPTPSGPPSANAGPLTSGTPAGAKSSAPPPPSPPGRGTPPKAGPTSPPPPPRASGSQAAPRPAAPRTAPQAPTPAPKASPPTGGDRDREEAACRARQEREGPAREACFKRCADTKNAAYKKCYGAADGKGASAPCFRAAKDAELACDKGCGSPIVCGSRGTAR